MTRFSWFSSALRIKDPARTVPFYTQHFNCTVLRTVHHPVSRFSEYFLTTLPAGVTSPAADSAEAEAFLWSYPNVVLRLRHDHGTESDADFAVNNGNVEPHRGFGHIAFNVDDVYAACATLEKSDLKFQKKPDEGRMKGLAFVLDPDGYWIEIVRRKPDTGFLGFNLSQTMIRVKDPEPSLRFYSSILGMKVLCERHFPDAGQFSLYFLATLPPDHPAAQEGFDSKKETNMEEIVKSLFNPVIELTHNHGTEKDDSFSYHNGVDEEHKGEKTRKGFLGLSFLVDDLEGGVELAVGAGAKVIKKADEGEKRGTVIVADPLDKYWIELVPKGLKETDYVLA